MEEKKIWRGEGYGYTPYRVGDGIEINGDLYIVISSSKIWVAEDGMSLGVGADAGHIYHATVRPANEAEIAAYNERRAATQAARDSERAAATWWDRMWRAMPGDFCRPPEGATVLAQLWKGHIAYEVRVEAGTIYMLRLEGSAEFRSSAPIETVRPLLDEGHKLGLIEVR